MLQNASEKSIILGEFPQQEFFASSMPPILINKLFEITANEVKAVLCFPCAQKCFAQMQNAAIGLLCVKREYLSHLIKF